MEIKLISFDSHEVELSDDIFYILLRLLNPEIIAIIHKSQKSNIAISA